MAINFYCPLGHRLTVPDERAGKKGRCPVCHQRVIAPVPNPQPSGRPKQPSPLGMGAPESGPPAPDHHEFELDDVLDAELGLEKKP